MGNWYEDQGLPDICKAIKNELNTTKDSFVSLGYWLKQIRDRKLYEETGHKNLYEFAKDQFGISKSSVSRFMAVNDRFSLNGNSPILLDTYREFSQSQMVEMLSLTDEQVEQVTKDSTVKQIRDMKPKKPKPVKETTKKKYTECGAYMARKSCDGCFYDDNDGCPYDKSGLSLPVATSQPEQAQVHTNCSQKECFMCAKECDERVENRYCREAPLGHPFDCTIMPVIDMVRTDIGDKCMFANSELAPKYESGKARPCCKECDNASCGYRCRRAVKHKPEMKIVDEDNEQEEPVLTGEVVEPTCEDDEPDDDYNEAFIKKVQDDDPEYFTVNDVREYILKSSNNLNICRRDNITSSIRRKCAIEVAAFQMLTDSMSEADDVKSMIQTAVRFYNLGDYGSADMYLFDARKKLNDTHNTQTARIPKVDEIKIIRELPVMKNKDQRSDFLDGFQNWQLWIDSEFTGERYYRYDLDEDVAIVVKVSMRHIYNPGKGYNREAEYDYDSPNFYLLGIEQKYTNNGHIFKINKEKTFCECATNKSAVVDFLMKWGRGDVDGQ